VTAAPELVEGVDPDAVVLAVLACPAVAGLHPGGLGIRAATYLPHRRVPGVEIRPGEIVLHVVARLGPTAAEVADQVRAAVRPLAPDRRVDVVLADVLLPGEAPPATR